MRGVFSGTADVVLADTLYCAMKRGIFECFQYPLESMRDASEFDVVNVMALPAAPDPPPPIAT